MPCQIYFHSGPPETTTTALWLQSLAGDSCCIIVQESEKFKHTTHSHGYTSQAERCLEGNSLCFVWPFTALILEPELLASPTPIRTKISTSSGWEASMMTLSSHSCWLNSPDSQKGLPKCAESRDGSGRRSTSTAKVIPGQVPDSQSLMGCEDW